jgi:prepilin-type N-terminal cleavage/methylation domain-containing protein
MRKRLFHKGFTLIETLVGVAVFIVVATAVYQAYASLFIFLSLNQYKILALNLANEQLEIARNLSYADVGIVSGIPSGLLLNTQTLVRGGVSFTVTKTVRYVDLPFDGTIGGTPPDTAPLDNKMVEIQIDCPTCKDFIPITLTTRVAPKNLETASSDGALLIKVFDANGQPVSNADVHIVNTLANPDIIINDTTDNNGILQLVGVPAGVNAYNITVSKSGYSTARTYPPNALGNPNPTQPDATVLVQQVTQVSLAIDKISALSFSSVSPTCAVIGNIDFSLRGSKNIGNGIPKYSQNLTTNGSGTYVNGNMEWDAYTVGSIDSSYDIIGIDPLNAISLNPNSTQNIKLIVSPKNPKSLLITVKDNSTGLPITDATVKISEGSSASSTLVTDRGYINQTDWSGGDSQEMFVDNTKYFFNDGNIDTDSPSGELKLKNAFGSYNPSGILESSIVDTGSASNFGNLVWSPTDQPPTTGIDSVKFQIATNIEITATTTWDYKGPDGTASSYYTLSDSTIHSAHNGDRFFRYKVLLSTNSSTSTPNISDLAFTYTSLCTPPGQVVYSGLSSGTYDISVSKSGYTTGNGTAIVSDDWIEKVIILSP